MKIGILTYHSVYNFGANLQVLSTVEYLRNNGYEPVIINWIPLDLETSYDHNFPTIQAEAHKLFIQRYLPCTSICRDERGIAEVIEEYNIKGIIIGSDAVLQHHTTFSRIHFSRRGITLNAKPKSDVLFPNPFWGSFIPYLKEKIPVVIMSASSQNTDYKFINGSLRKKMEMFLKQFQSVTVRDDWTRKMIKHLSHGTIITNITPDPVFAYNQNVKEQYTKADIIKKFKLQEKYLLFSFYDTKVVSKDWLTSFKVLAEMNNLQCVALTMPNGMNFDPPFDSIIEVPLSPKEWYGLIKYSSGYIGEKMHPIVIALHNVVPFFSFDLYGIVNFKFIVNYKSSKIFDILSHAGLLKNRVSILRSSDKRPTPEYVFSQISNFDYEKCRLFSNNQLEKYNTMMKDISTILNQSVF